MVERERIRQRVTPSQPALRPLEAFIGEWDMMFSIDGLAVGRGWAIFSWLEDHSFVVQQADAELSVPGMAVKRSANSPMPLTTIIGFDDLSNHFSMLYADARGVLRIYQMSFRDGIWKLWRDAPGFFQRFTATFSDENEIITGCWETSSDGLMWEYDFEVTYSKVR